MLGNSVIHEVTDILLIVSLVLLSAMIMVITYFLAKYCIQRCEISQKRKKVLVYLSMLMVFLLVFTAVFTPIFFELVYRSLIEKTGTGPKANLKPAINYTVYFALSMLFVISLLFLAINVLKKPRDPFFTTKTVTRLAVFSALSFVLYYFAKFNLPFAFPQFLEIHVSEMPALLAGFMMGPQAGVVVLIVRAFLKLPFTSTGGVGELGDLILGLVFVLSSSIIYSKLRTKKGAVVALIVGGVCCTLAAIVVNRVILIPVYAALYSWDTVVGMVKSLYPNITKDSFYTYFLLIGTLPFNALRCILVVLVTFFMYKPTKRVFGFVEKRAAKRITKDEK